MTQLVAYMPWFLVTVLIAVWWTFFVMYRGFRRRRTELEQRIMDLQEALRQSEVRAARMLVDREQKSGFYGTLVERLPGRIHELMAGSDSRQVAGQVIDTVVDLFDPTEVVLFTVIQDKEQLVLSAAHGIPASKIGNRYPFGRGRPGVVAMKGVTMTTRDFLNESMQVKKRIQADPSPECQQDVLTPLLNNNQVIGVLGMKRISRDLSQEEMQIFRMVAQLASIAFAFRSLLTRYKKMAHQDGLTGLVNKQHFMIMLGDMLMNASITVEPVSIFMFDIDHFKNYNDRNGHLEGDRLLQQLAELVRSNIREGDVAGRYGGEEFIVAFPGLDRKGAGRVAEFLRRKIEKHPFPHREGQPKGILSVSGGVATYPGDGETAAELISVADARLYEAKHKGRNLVVTFR